MLNAHVTGYEPSMWNLAAASLQEATITAAIVYISTSFLEDLAPSDCPTLVHLAGQQSKVSVDLGSRKLYHYADLQSPHFATPSTEDFHYSSEGVSHTRNLTFLKKHMKGPCFDLEAIWEEHTYYEFENRSVENTMNTMVQEPYVNHVPTVITHM